MEEVKNTDDLEKVDADSPIESDSADDQDSPELASDSPPPRLGNVEKCPVCGSSVDSEAYCCPTCHSFYCYHCRARVLETDPQYQCINQACSYHGRLMCGVCDQEHQEDDEPMVYMEPEDGFWPMLLLAALVVGLITWGFGAPGWLWPLGSMAVVFTVGSLLVMAIGRSVFGRDIRIEQQRFRDYHTCLCCGQEVKQLSGET